VQRRCLIVLGMHYAGTGALTRVLTFSGAKLPAGRVMGRGAGTSLEHWKPDALVAYHDQLLAEIGSSWHDWGRLDLTRLGLGRRSEVKAEVREIIVREFGDAPLLILEDPRICRLTELVMEALKSANIEPAPILMVRNPLEVVEALEAHHGMRRADAALLWLRHVLDAEAVTRHRPRAITTYDGLMENWVGEVERISSALSVTFPYVPGEIAGLVEGCLEKGFRQHRHDIELDALDSVVRGWVSDAYAAMCILVRSPDTPQAFADLDRIRRKFDAAYPDMKALVASASSNDHTPAEREISALSRKLDALTDEIARGQAAWRALSANLEKMARSLESEKGRSRQLEEQLAHRDREAEALVAHIHQAYQKSTSCKLTSPLRGVKHIQIAAGRMFRIVPAALRIGGGIIPTARKAIGVLRREGIGGVRWRVRGLSNTDANTLGVVRGVGTRAYVDQILSIATKAGTNLEFVPKSPQAFDLATSPIKAIAFYLPQFHPVPENDAWWGKGFTEWTNVTKAVPQFVGHHQPHLPGELGFYDLRLIDVQRQQIELAKHYGIHGFCYHHYWFGGRRLLEGPFNQVLANPDLDLPFCLCWANENWTRRWDGLDQEILIGQKHSPEDDLAFIADIALALRDPRYIRFNGRPVLIVYRVNRLPDAKATAARWREYCRNEGIGELYLVAARSFGVTDPRPYGFDAAVEFPPLESHPRRMNSEIRFINPAFDDSVFRFDEMVDSYLAISANGYTNIKAVCPGWDNEARRPGKGHIFRESGALPYSRWLRGACAQTLHAMSNNSEQPPFVFINAWNEWAEGAHLEPDRKFGYSNLHVTATVLQDFKPQNPSIEAAILQSQANFRRTSDGALVLHLYYADLLPELKPYLAHARNMDLFVSLGPEVPSSVVDELRSDFPNCYLAMYRNRGRDTLPFMNLLRVLAAKGYVYGCKVHTKKSPHRDDGSKLRNEAFEALLGSPDHIERLTKMFKADPSLGIVAQSQSMLDLCSRNESNRRWLDALLPRLGCPELVGNYRWQFVAGTMFWFRVPALTRLLSLELTEHDFEDELGQVDGTLAHAIERLITLCCTTEGYAVKSLG